VVGVVVILFLVRSAYVNFVFFFYLRDVWHLMESGFIRYDVKPGLFT
jgi:hypothetical protein